MLRENYIIWVKNCLKKAKKTTKIILLKNLTFFRRLEIQVKKKNLSHWKLFSGKSKNFHSKEKIK